MPPQKRFVRRGVSKFFYLKTVAATSPTAGPTRAEITAGVDVTDWIRAVTGFAVTAASIPAPDMGSRFDKTIPGNTSVADSSFTFYESIDDTEVEETFPLLDEGYVYIMLKGDKPLLAGGALYPVRVAARTPGLTADMTPAEISVGFSFTGDPRTDLVIPALTP